MEELANLIGKAWVSAEGSGLAEGVSEKTPAVAAMTGAVAEGIFAHADRFALPKGFMFLAARGDEAPLFTKGLSWDGTRIRLEKDTEASLIVCLCAVPTEGTDASSVTMTFGTDTAVGLEPPAFPTGSVLALAF